MSKVLRAISIGLHILAEVEQLATGGEATFSFSWKGRTYNLTVKLS